MLKNKEMRLFSYVLLLMFFAIVNIHAQTESEFLTTAVKEYSLKEYTKSAETYSKAIAINNLNLSAYFNRGLCYFRTEDYTKAIADFSIVIAKNSNDIDAINYRAQSYQWAENYPQALSDFNKLIELKPNSIEALYNRGLINYNLSNYKEAISDFAQQPKRCRSVFNTRNLLFRNWGISKSTHRLIYCRKETLKLTTDSIQYWVGLF